MGQIISRTELITTAQEWRAQKLKVVLTNGCFDLLHVGHLKTFREAKSYGQLLVVGLNTDQTVRRLKGETRPLISEAERAELVAALEPVDIVTVFAEPTASSLIEIIQPQVYVKGGDYTLDSLPEREALLRFNVEVKFVPLVTGISTTDLVRRIKTANI